MVKGFLTNRVRHLALFGLGLFGLTACVTPYQPDTISTATALVVEGLITNQPGPYTVKLTRTADYALTSLNLLETGALVVIADTVGNQEVLQELTPGVYSTKKGGIQGVLGRTYKLRIQTKDATIYESDLERLKACPPIDRLYYEYQYDPTALTNDKANLWNVFIDTQDPASPGDFYRWEWTHYQFLDYCALVAGTNDVGISCCSNCWDITRCNINCINITSDVAINGHAISRQPITQVTYDGGQRYYLEVKQQSLSAGVYSFFKRTAQLIANTGGLFDTAPRNVGGNLHALNKAGALVYGYFGAAGESEASILVDRSAARGNPAYFRVTVNPLLPCVSCENSPVRTSIRPRWWPN